MTSNSAEPPTPPEAPAPPEPPAEVVQWLASVSSRQGPSRDEYRAAVKAILSHLREAAPGYSVEIRVPPYAAIQAIGGARHRRGTPPAVVQMDPESLIGLALGRVSWAEAINDGRVRASGERSDLGWLLPMFTERNA